MYLRLVLQQYQPFGFRPHPTRFASYPSSPLPRGQALTKVRGPSNSRQFIYIPKGLMYILFVRVPSETLTWEETPLISTSPRFDKSKLPLSFVRRGGKQMFSLVLLPKDKPLCFGICSQCLQTKTSPLFP